MICGLAGAAGKTEILIWIWPFLICLVGLPLHWHLGMRVRARSEQAGIRPRFRKDLVVCWLSINGLGFLWTAGLGISGVLATHWYLLCFIWASLYFVGYVVNGVLLSAEWFWAAAVLGRRNAIRHAVGA